jgi:hypothetical protein
MQWPFLVSGFSFPVESARHEAETRAMGTLFTHHMSGEAQGSASLLAGLSGLVTTEVL